MNSRMECSCFVVLVKVEQLNDNSFLNTCVVKSVLNTTETSYFLNRYNTTVLSLKF